jgi:FRG domain
MTRARAKIKSIASHSVGSIIEFTTLVCDFDEPHWFRGHGMDDSYKIRPSLYRRKSSLTSEELYELEFKMIQRFRERSMPFVGDKFSPQRYDDLSILFYMQHYGVPTRLLDWTENPYVALYFALNDVNNYNFSSNEFKENACVWVMEPNLWNNVAIKVTPKMGIISVPNSDPVNGYLPKSESEPRVNRPDAPIAITGFHNSPRIVAQRGVFVVYGAENIPMDELFLRDNYTTDSLFRILIKKEAIGKMRKSLYNMGIADSVIYPDMHGFSSEIIRYFEL